MATAPFDWAPLPLRPLVEAAVAAGRADPRVVVLAVGGSGTFGALDESSDLDLVVVCRDQDHPGLLRDAPASAASLGPLFSSFTGEHVCEPRLLLCLFGPPLVRVDLKFVADQISIIASRTGGSCGNVPARSTQPSGGAPRSGPPQTRSGWRIASGPGSTPARPRSVAASSFTAWKSSPSCDGPSSDRSSPGAVDSAPRVCGVSSRSRLTSC
jgi:hypothetical protein